MNMFPPSSHLSTFASSLACEPSSTDPFSLPSSSSDLFSIHRNFPFAPQNLQQPPINSHTNQFAWSAAPPPQARAPTSSFTSAFGFSDAPGFSARVTVNSYASPSAAKSSSTQQFFSNDASFDVPSVQTPMPMPQTCAPSTNQNQNNLIHLAAILQMINRPGSYVNNDMQAQTPLLPVPPHQPQALLPQGSSGSNDSLALLRLLENALSKGSAPSANTLSFPAPDTSSFNNNFFSSNSNNNDAFLPLQPFSSTMPSSFPMPPPLPPAPSAPASADPAQLNMLLNLFAAAKAKSQARSLAPDMVAATSAAQSNQGFALDTRQPSFVDSNQAVWNEFTVPSTISDLPMVSVTSTQSAAPVTVRVKPEPIDYPSSPALSESSANQWESSPAPTKRQRETKVKEKEKPKSAGTKNVKKEGKRSGVSLKKKKRCRLHRSGKDLEFLSEIVCGQIETQSADFTVKDVQETRVFEPFFGREVEVFTAVKDSERRRLFQTTELTKSLKCSNNMLAMYLARRKRLVNSGIYQATSILYKRNCRKDVKCSGYFITLDACQRFAQYLEQRKIAAQVKAEEDRLVHDTKSTPLIEASPADSIHTAATESSFIGDDRLLLPASVDGRSV